MAGRNYCNVYGFGYHVESANVRGAPAYFMMFGLPRELKTIDDWLFDAKTKRSGSGADN